MKHILLITLIIIHTLSYTYERKYITRGLTYYKINLKKNGKNVNIHILRINPKFRKIVVDLAGKTIKECLPLSDIVKNKKAIAGINGTFYWSSMGPIGMLIKDFELISIPIMKRTSIGITNEGKIIWDNPVFNGRIDFNKRNISISIDGINQLPEDDKIILFTQEFGKKTPRNNNVCELILISNLVFEKLNHGNNIIPPGGYILSAYGKSKQLLKNIHLLDTYFLNIGLQIHWEITKYAIGGGPRLIKNGKLISNYKTENFKNDVLVGRAPRSAIGVSKSGLIYLIVVDGRNAGNSIGMTLLELAIFMSKLGCVNAMNLDGGGSSTMVINGKVVNNPSDGYERKINNAILIY